MNGTKLEYIPEKADRQKDITLQFGVFFSLSLRFGAIVTLDGMV